MNDTYSFRPGQKQSGAALLEAMIAILIFSLGILTVIGIQASSIRMTADAQYRTKAALLADRLIGEMWASGGTIADLQTNFLNDPAYTNWLSDVGDVEKGGLPGISGKPPVVGIANGDNPSSATVSIEIFWQTPAMASDNTWHQHTVTSQISRNP